VSSVRNIKKKTKSCDFGPDSCNFQAKEITHVENFNFYLKAPAKWAAFSSPKFCLLGRKFTEKKFSDRHKFRESVSQNDTIITANSATQVNKISLLPKHSTINFR